VTEANANFCEKRNHGPAPPWSSTKSHVCDHMIPDFKAYDQIRQQSKAADIMKNKIIFSRIWSNEIKVYIIENTWNTL
jgi:hypothetical protein